MYRYLVPVPVILSWFARLAVSAASLSGIDPGLQTAGAGWHPEFDMLEAMDFVTQPGSFLKF